MQIFVIFVQIFLIIIRVYMSAFVYSYFWVLTLGSYFIKWICIVCI